MHLSEWLRLTAFDRSRTSYEFTIIEWAWEGSSVPKLMNLPSVATFTKRHCACDDFKNEGSAIPD